MSLGPYPCVLLFAGSGRLILAGRFRVSEVFLPLSVPAGRYRPWVLEVSGPLAVGDYPLELVVSWSATSANEAAREAEQRGLKPGDLNSLMLVIEPVVARRGGQMLPRLRCKEWLTGLVVERLLRHELPAGTEAGK
ncbi:MAG: hypothetical protein N2652_11725 [Kiritimatiellae bacterium]|nr:hypothetical protein [Kiritimatiellia bacterium]